MKIISWNVNGFRSVATKHALSDLIKQEYPDLLFLQEIKCKQEEAMEVSKKFAVTLRANYAWFVEESKIPGRHGVALLIKEELAFDEEGNSLVRWLESEAIDPPIDGVQEARMQAFIINEVLYINTYSVNVRLDLCRLQQRAAYDDQIFNLLNMWAEQGNTKAVIVGDFNVVSDVIDYHGPSLSANTAGMTESERASFKTLLRGHKLTDTFRELHPEEAKYSYWSYRGYARDNNKGWRLDYALVTPDVFSMVTNADILTDIPGSDHAPIVLELRD